MARSAAGTEWVILVDNSGGKAMGLYTAMLEYRVRDAIRAMRWACAMRRRARVRLLVVRCMDDLGGVEAAVGGAPVRAIILGGSSEATTPPEDVNGPGPRTAWNVAALRRWPGACVLGVCYGLQVLGAMGGVGVRPVGGGLRQGVARVSPEPGSFLAGPELAMEVSHRSTLRGLPAGYACTARDGRGTVMAIERGAPPLALGVQFHPEAPRSQPQGDRLIRRFLERALAGPPGAKL